MKLTIELPAALHRDLVAYAQALSRETAQGAVEPTKLIAPMLARFMATDRAFVVPFGAAARGDPLYEARVQLGRLLRTIFFADYWVNPHFRPDIMSVLNRGEMV